MDYFFMTLNGAAMLLLTAALLDAGKYYLHFLQLESYYLAGYSHSMFKKWYAFLLISLPALLALVPVEWLSAPVMLMQALAVFLTGKRLLGQSNSKKPLVVTARIKRIMAAQTLIMLLAASALGVCFSLKRMCGMFGLIPALLPFVVALAALVTKPLEFAVRQYYIADAKKRLASVPGLKIIGITGSYGKTSTKFLLSTILGEKYSVLTPPSSYNTTLGVVRVIRERLQSDDQVFICEMGSRHLGDIKEICRFVKPDIGIITSIGPQHLETFGSMENIVKGKFELIEAVKDSAFFPLGNEYTERMYEKAKSLCNAYTFGIGSKGYMHAENLTVGPDGSCFALVNQEGESVFCTTELLGEHNVQNIVGCAAVAYKMGLTMEQIARGISKLRPVEHRLQIVTRRPMTVIDDAFNSSPNGAKAALKVLASFPGRRIIITPGFVELGQSQEEYHREFGRQIASSADIAVLVGERTAAIKQGLLEAGFDSERIITVDSLSGATDYLAAAGRAGDTILFENDLPDNY